MFCEGFSPYEPFWEHYLEHWKESLARPQEVGGWYEELMSDPLEVVRILASFCSVPFTKVEERRGVPEEVLLRKQMFFRKGMVGDWKNHMSREMGRKLDDVVEDKLKGSGLVF
uniref:Sulfotransferase n=1 Tax=Setaria viridis TaxID=4556 RepID=A0A4U6VWA1_SETVI|nr:hypothetical protein SEVIR_2G156600v2 [Setaria viridis]